MTQPTQAQIEAAAISFTKAIFGEYWPGCHDIDGATVHELGEKYGVIVKVKYDPEVHGEAEYDQEPGDDWFVLNPALTAAAQVGEPILDAPTVEFCIQVIKNMAVSHSRLTHGPEACETLIAGIRDAAQVGEADDEPYLRPIMKAVEDDTIERCAQVVEMFIKIDEQEAEDARLIRLIRIIAAEIRRLKDAP